MGGVRLQLVLLYYTQCCVHYIQCCVHYTRGMFSPSQLPIPPASQWGALVIGKSFYQTLGKHFNTLLFSAPLCLHSFLSIAFLQLAIVGNEAHYAINPLERFLGKLCQE